MKTRAEVKAAEEIAKRELCEDFEKFKPIFNAVQEELKSGLREAKLLTKNAQINQGDLFVLFGQKPMDFPHYHRQLRAILWA